MGEKLEFLVKHIFLQQYRNTNTAFVPDNSKKINQQEPNSNLLCSLYYLALWMCIYFQVIKQTCWVLIIKWFQFLGIDFGWPTTKEKMGAVSVFRQALMNIIFHDVVSSNLFKKKKSRLQKFWSKLNTDFGSW